MLDIIGPGNSNDLGVESLLGDYSLLEDAQEGRDRLALALRYLSNWYDAAKDAQDSVFLKSRIDNERYQIETAYKAATDSRDALFFRQSTVDLYNAAAGPWPQLYRDLALAVPDASLLSKVASVITSPFAGLPTMGNEVGKAIGGLFGELAAQFTRKAFPAIVLVGVVGTIYYFRKPLAVAINKVIS